MAGDRSVTLDLGENMTMVVLAEQQGPQMVADDKIVATLDRVTGPIERVSGEMLEAVKRISPSKATVELGFGLAIEQGQLLALFGKGKGEASIKVTLEWSASAGE